MKRTLQVGAKMPTRPVGAVLLVLVLGAPTACGEPPSSPEPPKASLGSCVPTDTLQLEGGDVADFSTSADEPACLALPPASATYSVAYFDPRLVALEREGREPTAPPLDDFHVDAEIRAVGDVDAASSVRRERSPVAFGRVGSKRVDHTLVEHATASCDPAMGVPSMLCRPEPWTLGDRFAAPGREGEQGESLAEVIAIDPKDELVVAAYVADLPEIGHASRSALADGLTRFRRHTMPILHATFPDADPVTSPGSGQLLLLMRRDGNPLSTARVRRIGGTLRHWISLSDVRGADAHFSVVSHEVTHSYQQAFADGGQRADWASEGGANLVSHEALRRENGLPLGGNLDPGNVTGDSLGYLLRIDRVDGELPAGYNQGAGFLRYLLLRGTRAGVDRSIVLREILQGSLHGWTGQNRGHVDPVGLAERMASILGEGPWDPAEAVLDWTISNALDDRWPGGPHRNRAVRRAWQDRPTPRRIWVGWKEDAAIGPSAPAGVRREAGSTGYLQVRTSPDARALRLTTSSAARWRIARHR